MEDMTQLRPPRCPGLSLGTRDAGVGEEIGRMGVGVSFLRGHQVGLVVPVTRVKRLEEESQSEN